jgi:hypothetical protein
MQELLFTRFQEFIEALDGVDNGVSQYPNDIQPKYRNRTDLSSRVGWLNPPWNQPADSQTVDVGLSVSCLDRCPILFCFLGPVFQGLTTSRGGVSWPPELLWQVVAPSS